MEMNALVRETSNSLLEKIYAIDYVESSQVICLERHVLDERGHAPLLDITAQACKHGAERAGATLCAECPFKLRLVEPKLAHSLQEILKSLQQLRSAKETRDTILT
ncbi:MAG: hypothetical protein ACW99U_14170 [Candidatus Thorarchaeota archaeon]|jgi:hypothetical protein